MGCIGRPPIIAVGSFEHHQIDAVTVANLNRSQSGKPINYTNSAQKRQVY